MGTEVTFKPGGPFCPGGPRAPTPSDPCKVAESVCHITWPVGSGVPEPPCHPEHPPGWEIPLGAGDMYLLPFGSRGSLGSL